MDDPIDRLQHEMDQLINAVRDELIVLPRWAFRVICFFWPMFKDRRAE